MICTVPSQCQTMIENPNQFDIFSRYVLRQGLNELPHKLHYRHDNRSQNPNFLGFLERLFYRMQLSYIFAFYHTLFMQEVTLPANQQWFKCDHDESLANHITKDISLYYY